MPLVSLPRVCLTGALLALAAVRAEGTEATLRLEAYRVSAEEVIVHAFLGSNARVPSVCVAYLLIPRPYASIPPQGHLPTSSCPPVILAEQQAEQGVWINWHEHPYPNHPSNHICLAVVLYSPSAERTLSPGRLFSFRLALQNRTVASFPLVGAIASNPVVLRDRAYVSSAASTTACPIGMHIDPTMVPVNCVPPPSPQRVKADCRQGKTARITWTAPTFSEPLEYRVYRSNNRDPDTAVPLGEGWIADTVFYDQDPVPESPPPRAGCFGAVDITCAYYWVRCRSTLTGCEGPLSEKPARGCVHFSWRRSRATYAVLAAVLSRPSTAALRAVRAVLPSRQRR